MSENGPTFIGMQFDPRKFIPINAHVKDGEEYHKYKFEHKNEDFDPDEPTTLVWSGRNVEFIDVPEEWLQAAKEGIETYTKYEVEL